MPVDNFCKLPLDTFFFCAKLFYRIIKIFMNQSNSQSMRANATQKTGIVMIVKLGLLIR